MITQIVIKLAIFIVLINLAKCVDSPRPHIIFMLIDDLGWNDVSFHGSLEIPTPNIDALAYSGIILNNYYVQPLCTPSRGSLMTGKYPIKLGLQHDVIGAGEPWGLSPNETILPQHLRKLGYATHCVGKWHLGYFKKEYLPTERGFDSFFGLYEGKGDYFTHVDIESDRIGLDFHENESLAWNYTGYYATEVFTNKSITIINSHDISKPLFLFISHQAVHAGNSKEPLQAPKNYTDKLSHIKDKDRQTFAGMTIALDESVGKVLEALHENNMLENSIIVFSTDNGGAVEGMDKSSGSNWPLRGSKYNMWEGGIRAVAFIWSQLLPDSKESVSNNLMHISDWLPTLYAAAGGDTADLGEIDGYNFWPSFTGNVSAPRNHILLNIDWQWKVEGIRKNQYKLLKGSVFNEKYNGWFGKQGKKTEKTHYNNKELKELRKVYESLFHESEVYKILSRKCENDFSFHYEYEFVENCSLNKSIEFDECKEIIKNHNKIHSMCLYALNPFSKPIVVDCGTKPKNASTNCRIGKQYCLFDIEKDPCEYNNLASALPKVTEELKELLNGFRNQTVPIRNEETDPKANPKYHGNAWVPWVEEISNITV